MAMRTSYVVQPFELKRKRLSPGRQDMAPTASGARKRAEGMAGRMPGAMALQVTADDETGEVDQILVLGRFGEVPEDFVEGLSGA